MLEIKEIIPALTHPNYKTRMWGEYQELKTRNEKLSAMNTKRKAGMLNFQPACPAELLEMQEDLQNKLLGVLKLRAELEGIDLSEDRAPGNGHKPTNRRYMTPNETHEAETGSITSNDSAVDTPTPTVEAKEE